MLPPASGSLTGATHEADPVHGMKSMLAEMRSSPPPSEAFPGDQGIEEVPELVSLDELLAEEEGNAWEDADWDEPRWGLKREADGRYH